MALPRKKVSQTRDDRDLYPACDGVPVEDLKHLLNAVRLRDTVVVWLRAQGREVFAAANNFIYYERGNRSGNVGPDFYAILDIPEDPERDCWRVWNEGERFPDVIVEFVSKSSERKDRVKNFAIYRDRLKVPSYFICNNRRGQLDGWELVDGEYIPLVPRAAGRLWCAPLGLWIGLRDGWLRWFDKQNRLLLTDEELAENAEMRAENAEMRAENADMRAENAEVRAESAEVRAESAEREIARLRSELEQLKPKRK